MKPKEIFFCKTMDKKTKKEMLEDLEYECVYLKTSEGEGLVPLQKNTYELKLEDIHFYLRKL